MKIITLSTPEISDYAEITGKVNMRYAQKWDYGFKHYRNKLDDRPPAWSKLLALLENWTEDWLLWIDADAQIMRNDLTPYEFTSDHDFILSQDRGHFNTGVFLVRCNQRAKDMVMWANSKIELTNDPWWDQAAFVKIFKDNQEYFTNFVRIEPKLSANGMKYKDEFAVHLPGTTKEERINAFTGKYKR